MTRPSSLKVPGSRKPTAPSLSSCSADHPARLERQPAGAPDRPLPAEQQPAGCDSRHSHSLEPQSRRCSCWCQQNSATLFCGMPLSHLLLCRRTPGLPPGSASLIKPCQPAGPAFRLPPWVAQPEEPAGLCGAPDRHRLLRRHAPRPTLPQHLWQRLQPDPHPDPAALPRRRRAAAAAGGFAHAAPGRQRRQLRWGAAAGRWAGRRDGRSSHRGILAAAVGKCKGRQHLPNRMGDLHC